MSRSATAAAFVFVALTAFCSGWYLRSTGFGNVDQCLVAARHLCTAQDNLTKAKQKRAGKYAKFLSAYKPPGGPDIEEAELELCVAEHAYGYSRGTTR